MNCLWRKITTSFFPLSFIFLMSVREGATRCMTACINFLFVFPCSESAHVRFFSFLFWKLYQSTMWCGVCCLNLDFIIATLFFCFHFIFNWILYILCFIKWGCVPEPLRLALSKLEISVNFSGFSLWWSSCSVKAALLRHGWIDGAVNTVYNAAPEVRGCASIDKTRRSSLLWWCWFYLLTHFDH